MIFDETEFSMNEKSKKAARLPIQIHSHAVRDEIKRIEFAI